MNLSSPVFADSPAVNPRGVNVSPHPSAAGTLLCMMGLL